MTLCDQYAIIEWYLLDAPTSSHGVITSFSAAACISGGIKFGRMLAQEYFVGQSSEKRVLKIVKIDNWCLLLLR